MKVILIARATLYTVRGGDTVQVLETAKHLTKAGVEASVRLTDEPIEYADCDLLHFFNITRPADMLYHIRRSGKPYVISPIYIDYSEYDKKYQKGPAGVVLRLFSQNGIEYIKTIRRWLTGRDKLTSRSYLWRGQKNSVTRILKKASLLLPNSHSEIKRLSDAYGHQGKYRIVPNGVDSRLFRYDGAVEKDQDLVICVARIEGIKNQLNLIRALNGSKYRLLLIGAYAPGQRGYYQECKRIAAHNVQFIDALAQEELVYYYQLAKTHVLPSWFETTGLSSLEAAASGCNIVITNRGDAAEYFGELAFYGDPASPASLYDAIEHATTSPANPQLAQLVAEKYTWEQATACTLQAYKELIE